MQAGDTMLVPELVEASTAEAVSDALPRESRVILRATLPDDGSDVTVGWDAQYGPIILRQIVQDLPEGQEAYSAFLGPGQMSAPMPRTGTVEITGLASFANYVWLGFTHILPKGLDHILFVLGLFSFHAKCGRCCIRSRRLPSPIRLRSLWRALVSFRCLQASWNL